MALFSRRPKKPAEPSPPTPDDATETTPQPSAPIEAAANGMTDASARPASSEPSPDEPIAEVAPSVNISVSTYGGLGAAPRTPDVPQAQPAQQAQPAPGSPDATTPQQTQAPAAQPRLGTREWMRTAPEPTETIPGLRDNVLLRAALGRVGDAPPSQAMLDVMRQLMQGHVFLRVKGDARTLLAEGKGLPLAVATAGERTFALVYSSGAALQASLKADGDTDTSAMGQPVLTVLNHVISSSYDGIIIDPASGASRAVLPKELLQRAAEQADPQLTVKTLLAAERTADIPTQIAQALTHVPLWVAVGSAEGGMPGLAEGRTEDGSRYLEVYSHPLEVAVMGRGDNAGPITGAQLARALRSEPQLTGIVVDPAGPWIRLTRDALAPLLALAE